jgi:3,4-dihydroxy 2-butanone 4-phosphate synthase/GTP cyclohydrolase II
MKSPGLAIAASLRKNVGFPADGYSENDDTLLRKSTSLRGQDHPTADSDLPLGSVAAAEIISTELSRVALADTFLNDENDAELDLDSPTEGFASIADAIEDIRQGKVSMPCNSLFHRVSATVNLSNKIFCCHMVFFLTLGLLL